jgi:glyoxylase I family protein
MTVQIEGVCTLIQVYDMLESVRFYREHLGFEIAQQALFFEHPYPHINWVLLRRGNAEFMLNTAYDADRRPPSRDPAWAGGHRDTTLFFGCPDVDGAYENLKNSGLSPSPPPSRITA